MTLMQAAKKWNLSPNWVRELVKSGRVPAILRDDVPVPYYDIPDDTPKPVSMQEAPFRKGTGMPTERTLKSRRYRAAKAMREAKAKPPRAKRKG